MHYSVKLVTLLLLTSIHTNTMDKLMVVKKVTPAILKYIAVAAGMEAGTTVCHEVGHGISYQTFFDNLHGFNFFGKPVAQGKVGNLQMSVGVNPLGKSKAVVSNVVIEDNTYKLLALTSVAAGPVTGVLATCMMKKGLSKTSLNQRAVTMISRLVHANNLSSLIPHTRQDKNNPETVITSDGQYMVNLYAAYKNNDVCDLAGTVLIKKQ